jgi:hypothetical protein
VIRQRAEKISSTYSLGATRKDPTGLCTTTQSFYATSSSTSERQHKPRIFDLSEPDVRCDAPVDKLFIDEGKRVKGVELMDGRKMFARKEAVACCGTQMSAIDNFVGYVLG